MGLWLAKPVSAQAPTIQQDEYQYVSEDLIIKENAIQRPFTENIKTTIPIIRPKGIGVYSGRHSTRAEKQISEQTLFLYLSEKHSPLAGFSSQILASPYYSTIIGICTIEQYGCTKAPFNNYWGIMCGKGYPCKYSDLHAGIEAIDAFLAKAEASGHGTVESLNGYYVQPASSSWLQTVLKIKFELENLQ